MTSPFTYQELDELEAVAKAILEKPEAVLRLIAAVRENNSSSTSQIAPADADLGAEPSAALEPLAALKLISDIAEHYSFVASAVGPTERALVVLGQAFLSIQTHARTAISKALGSAQ